MATDYGGGREVQPSIRATKLQLDSLTKKAFKGEGEKAPKFQFPG